MKNLIDRDILLKNYCDLCKELHHTEGDIGDGCEDCREILIIKEQQIIQIDEKEKADEITTRHGYWKVITESEISGWDVSLTGGYDPIALYVCSECGEDNIIDEFGENFLPKYCPFCGARLMNNYMDDDNDE